MSRDKFVNGVYIWQYYCSSCHNREEYAHLGLRDRPRSIPIIPFDASKGLFTRLTAFLSEHAKVSRSSFMGRSYIYGRMLDFS